MFRVIGVLALVLFSTTIVAKSIVVLGDSISAGYGIDVKKGWVALLQEKLIKGNKSCQIFNASISGDTTAGGLARIDQVLADYKPGIILLELGANDGLRGLSPRLMENNLAEIIRRAEKNGAKVMLLGMRIPPNYGKRYVDMFYQVYPELAKKMNITLVPFILEDVALAKELMQQDGLHPNEKAQRIIADKIWQYLRPVLAL